MKRPLLAVLWIAACVCPPAYACMNDYNPNATADGRSGYVIYQLREHDETEKWPLRRDRLQRELAAGGDYRVKNDLATALAHTGNPAESVRLLLQIEEEKPGLYRTASNLGTAYELVGENQKALEWIRRGLERDATSHAGSEWLHVRILEAKLALAANRDWLKTNSVLGPRQDGPTFRSATGNRGESLSPDKLKNALIYQLHERLRFVQPPDAIVGDLLLALGDLVAQEPTGIGGALGLFELSEQYLASVPNMGSLIAVAQQQAGLARRAQQKLIRDSESNRTGGMILGGGLLVGLSIWLFTLARRVLAFAR